MFEGPQVPGKENAPDKVEGKAEFVPITQAEVVDALDTFGITDPRAMAALREYEESLAAATEVIAVLDSQGGLRAEVGRAMRLAELYGATKKYQNEKRATLEEALVLASQSDDMVDLVTQIYEMLDTEA
jgi:hypothetical protein